MKETLDTSGVSPETFKAPSQTRRRSTTSEPRIARPLLTDETATIIGNNENTPDISTWINTWEDGLTPLGLLADQRYVLATGQEIFEEVQRLKKLDRESTICTVGQSAAGDLIRSEWSKYKLEQKRQTLIAYDGDADEFLDPDNILTRRFSRFAHDTEGYVKIDTSTSERTRM